MCAVQRARIDEAANFAKMEEAVETSKFIIPYTRERHISDMTHPDIIYLSILAAGQTVGFIILAIEADNETVEFRRIVVAAKGNGIGQKAITEMERFCQDELKLKRIWLDVFEDNAVGRHIYQKLGYGYFKSEKLGGRTLQYYQKTFG